MALTSTAQVAMWNSERRRRALVRSWACIMLESATRTGVEPATRDDGELMERCSRLILCGRRDLSGAIKRTQGRVGENFGVTLNSGKRAAMLWKYRGRRFFERRLLKSVRTFCRYAGEAWI